METKMDETVNELKAKFTKFKNTSDGKKILIVGIICFLLGVVWQIIAITAILMAVGYLVYKKSTESKKK